MDDEIGSAQLSKFTGVSERTLRDWMAKGIVPRGGLAESIRAVVAHYRNQVEEMRLSPGQVKTNLNEEKTRLTKAQADKVELEISEREGLLVNAEEVKTAWASYVTACRSRLLSLPVRVALEVAPLTDPNQIQALIGLLVGEALNELASDDFVDGSRPIADDGEII